MAMGNALTSIVVVNGQITGTWKRRDEKGTALITIELFDRLTKAEHQALEAAVQAYGDFLGMPAAHPTLIVPQPVSNASGRRATVRRPSGTRRSPTRRH